MPPAIPTPPLAGGPHHSSLSESGAHSNEVPKIAGEMALGDSANGAMLGYRKGVAMKWDLGLLGFATLLGMALAFGFLAELIAGRGVTRWLWLIGSGVYLVSGLLISEAWFGWATEEELQPNIDGLSFDETLLALVPGIAAVIITRRLWKRRGHGGPHPA